MRAKLTLLLEKTAVQECELLFLRAAADHPMVRLEASLRDKVLLPLKRVWPTSFASNSVLELPPEYDCLIGEWATGHNLPYEWVIPHARRAVLIWLIASPTFSAFGGSLAVSPPSFHPPLRLPGESDGTYLTRQVRQFRLEADANMRESQRPRKQLLPNRGSRAAHFRWAVEQVCLGWTWAKIADANDKWVSYQAVRQAVLPILKKIGIPKTKPNQLKK